MGAIGSQLAAAAGVEVELRSAHGPWLTWTPDTGDEGAPAAASEGGGAPWLMRWLRPEVLVHTAFGAVRKAPWGSPAGTTWPLVPVVAAIVLLAVVALAVYGLVTFARRVAR